MKLIKMPEKTSLSNEKLLLLYKKKFPYESEFRIKESAIYYLEKKGFIKISSNSDIFKLHNTFAQIHLILDGLRVQSEQGYHISYWSE